MKTLPPPVSDAERAVHAYKHKLIVRVMTAILDTAMRKTYLSPADLPPDLVEPEHRQGVTSNAWNSLTALEIIERLPMHYNDAKLGIFGGRIANTNPAAKGRWTGCYRLVSRALAQTWLERNGRRRAEPEQKATQMEMV